MIIFGLGNPGLKYRRTRHNAGYIFLENLARTSRKRFSNKRRYKIATLRIKNCRVLLIKPDCWMNQCGTVIRDILQDEKEDFLIVLDDINLPLGRMRLRSTGSDGGHLGLRSIINMLSTCNFPRLRLGVGQPPLSVDAEEYVLKSFKSDEIRIFNDVLRHGMKGIRMLVSDGFVKAQNYINSFKMPDIEQDSNRFD
ncbi:MAG: aminoacyl-tRNA hydrolase [candidate division WOR-3 bacterium]|nr:MAG: aminoacyl-tRNA hydrolase [candidate division WOR-3 bacterium]